MPKRRLAIILFLTVGLAAAVDLALILALAWSGHSFAAPLGAATGFVPGLAFAVQAWRGTLRVSCNADH